MPLTLKSGVWVLGPGGGLTPVAITLAPDSGTPSSIADGATLDAGLFSGWKIKDANSGFVSIADDGTTCDVVVNAVSGDSEMTTANIWLTNPRIYLDTPLMGDFSFSMRFDSDAAMGSALTQLALMVGDGNAVNEAHGVCARFGRWQTSNGRNIAYYLVDSGGTLESASDAVAWATSRELQIKRVAGTITVSKRVGAGDSWAAYSTQNLDVAGGHCSVAIIFYAATAGEKFRFYLGEVSGYEYTASP